MNRIALPAGETFLPGSTVSLLRILSDLLSVPQHCPSKRHLVSSAPQLLHLEMPAVAPERPDLPQPSARHQVPPNGINRTLSILPLTVSVAVAATPIPLPDVQWRLYLGPVRREDARSLLINLTNRLDRTR